MAAISQKITNIIGGVSQQPDTIKVGNQLRICDNYYPDVATGLTKRPGLRGISKLANTVADGTWFTIFRDDEEKYIVQFSKAGALKIWSANNGVQQTVNAVAAEATTYATHTKADDLQTLQINDYIFVLNRNKTVAAGTNTSAAYQPFGFVNINTVAFNTDYTITIDSNTFSHTTPSNASGSTQNSVQTIINALVTSINGNVDYIAQGIGNTIFIRRVNNADFALKATGGTTGSAVEAFKETVTAVAQLPREFLSNRRIKVEGSAESTADEYWVQFVPSTPGQTSGVGHWEETIAPGTVTDLDEETMPHVIIREANGTFTYRQLDLASATGSTGPTSVSGIPTNVTIADATSGGHVVGEIFAVTGGTGNNLRLRVDKVQSIVNATTTAANSGSYVRQIIKNYGFGNPTKGLQKFTTKSYDWFVNSIQIGTTSAPSLTVGNAVYTANGAFQTISNQLRAGLTITTITNGIISAISVVQAGQGYTATNLVQNTAGDTFTIVSVNTAPLEGDSSRLKYWKYRDVGDATTNPMPSFVGNTIDGISFFKNRIIFTSRQNAICSQAGDYFNFFASTVITIVDSDPLTLVPVALNQFDFKHAIASQTSLLLFGDNAQYVLETTTEAFAPKTAEINLLSSFSQTDRFLLLILVLVIFFLKKEIKLRHI
jgi:hypothetical protein